MENITWTLEKKSLLSQIAFERSEEHETTSTSINGTIAIPRIPGYLDGLQTMVNARMASL